MAIQAGDRMPSGVFGVMTDAGPGAMSTDELFAGKKVVLMSVPGAFTPTCSAKHLPGFVEMAGELKAKGVDTIACVAVNDVFVMDAWGTDPNVGDKVVMLADGTFGMGTRSQRFAIVVDDGVATHVAVEAPGQLAVSKAESILAAL